MRQMGLYIVVNIKIPEISYSVLGITAYVLFAFENSPLNFRNFYNYRDTFLVMVKCSKCQNFGHKKNNRKCPLFHPGPVHNSLISARKERDHIKKKYKKLVKRILANCAKLPNSFERKLKKFRKLTGNNVSITEKDIEKREFKESMSKDLDFISSLTPPKYNAPIKKMRSRSSSTSSNASGESSSDSSTIIEIAKEVKRK